MQQQKSKKGSSPWLHCEKCFTNILNKDVEKHSGDCPPNPATSPYNFIKDGVLFGSLDLKVNEDIKGVSDKDSLVFLSQAAVQLCSLAIGEWASIKPHNSPSVAKIVWPTTEKTLTSVLLTKHALELTSSQPNSSVTVKALGEDLLEAARVVVVILNKPYMLEVGRDLNNRIHKTNIDKIFCAGNKFSLMYYGKLLLFEIKTIESRFDQLEDQLQQLTIRGDCFFKITTATSWILFNNEAHFVKETSKNDLVSRIGGLDSEIAEIREGMSACIKSRKTYGLRHGNSVLLYGNSGTGKTLVATALAQESKVNVVNISASDLYSKYTGSAEETIKELFQEAIDRAPSVVVLDEIDVLCPTRNQRMNDSEKRIISTLLTCLDNLYESHDCPVFIIATTNKPDSIDPVFRRCGRLDREIEIGTPNPKAREEILLKLLKTVTSDLNEEDLKEIALNTHGFVGADLAALCSRAGLSAARREAEVIQREDFQGALKHVRPSAMREVQVEVANVKWSDIGGQARLKLMLRQSVEWPQRHPESFTRLGITPPKGVLLYGPPGCSKTMIAKALATETGLNFLSIKGPELFSKWVGESERAVREVFRKARQVAPSIIFFDEIDALGGERTAGSSTSVQERVLAQLLTELDGVSPLGDVTVLAATNRPDRIDKALLRPGRLDRIIYVPLPDQNTRREIFKLKFTKMPVVGVDVEELVVLTEKYSGAEVNAVCHEAAMKALEESLEAEVVKAEHFREALKLITPRTSNDQIKMYEDYANNQRNS